MIHCDSRKPWPECPDDCMYEREMIWCKCHDAKNIDQWYYINALFYKDLTFITLKYRGEKI
jgi:hypothetical protein